MAKTKKVGPAASFGARYGTVVRKRYAEIITQMRRLHECPRCKFKAVSRVSVGIWECKKCGLKFAGGAYAPFTKLGEISKRTATETQPTQAGVVVKPEIKEKASKKKKGRKKKESTMKEEVL